MLKKKEAKEENSCWNRASDREWVFVLLARDPAAQEAIEAWVKKRIELGKNTRNDPQILEALQCAEEMRRQRCIGVPPK